MKTPHHYVGFAQRRASPTAAGEAGEADKRHEDPSRLPSGKRGRRLGAGAWFGSTAPAKEQKANSDCA